MTPETDRLRRALAFAVAEMPDADAQQAISDYYNQARRDELTEKEIVEGLTMIVVDGLSWGNWPTTNA